MKFTLRKNLTVAAFVLPALIPLAVFWIWPIFNAAYISLTNWDYMTAEYDFVAFRQYEKLLSSGEFHKALLNTLVFCAASAVLTIAGGLGLASLLHRGFRGSGLFRALFFSPWITPTVAVSLVWMWIFDEKNGIANAVIGLFGLPALKWVGSSATAMLAVIIVTVWKSVGYAMVFYLTALDKVPKSLYEAAALDRASRRQSFFWITLPCISPTTFFLAVVTTINGLQAYDQIQILTQGGPAGSTRTLLYLYYQLGFEKYDMGRASALAVTLLLLCIALSFAQNLISKRMVHY
ncbi:MAG: sugar ABC transporter permease [Oscillospiraceae bacterium]|nr:sugar ABC transporter permease [Oscillospiraceae bacterium]